MKRQRFAQLPFTKLIVFALCLLVANPSFSQNNPPVLIPLGQDTLVGISPYQFDLVLFGFSYIRSLENTVNLTSKQLSTCEYVNTYLEKVTALERAKLAEKDSIALNLESVIKDYKKAQRREKVKSTFAYIGLGLLAGAEAGVITYLLLR